MTAKDIPFTKEVYEKRLKEGRGQGIGKDYVPWILRSEILSFGTRHHASCGRFEREAHLFSVTEHKAFLFYDLMPWVTAIYEQYPLPRDETREIARDLGIEHPTDTNTREHVVVTTDLVVEGATAAGAAFKIARSCKLAKDLPVFNYAEHAEIERRFWEKRNVDWRYFVESDEKFPQIAYDNLELMSPHRFKHREVESYEGCLLDNCSLLVDALMKVRQPQSLLTFAKSIQRHLNGGYLATELLLYLIYRGRLVADVFNARWFDQDALSIANASRDLAPPKRRFA